MKSYYSSRFEASEQLNSLGFGSLPMLAGLSCAGVAEVEHSGPEVRKFLRPYSWGGSRVIEPSFPSHHSSKRSLFYEQLLCAGGAREYVMPVHVPRFLPEPGGVRELSASAQRRVRRSELSVADETLAVSGGG
jgi:hypothetical protein